MSQAIMLSCYSKSTIMAEPWEQAGYLCYCIDIQHPPGETREGNIIKVGADLRYWHPPRGNIVFAAFFPPCTHLASSGARWFKTKGLRALSQSIELFAVSKEIADNINCRYLIENPVSTISTYWRKPDYTFDPCDYGDPYTKKTCLWTGGGFIMPPKTRVEPVLGSKMHLLPPSESRSDLRSVTPRGFAQAVFEFNKEQAHNV